LQEIINKKKEIEKIVRQIPVKLKACVGVNLASFFWRGWENYVIHERAHREQCGEGRF